MALGDHFRELRARLLRSALVIVIAFALALSFYSRLFELLLDPYNQARALLGASQRDSMPVINGIAGAFVLELRICALAAILVTSPFWLYQIWAFIVPGLHANERRWTRIFATFGGPLFLIGAVIGYLVLPRGLEALISFNPHGVQNLVDISTYLNFAMRMMFAFGVAFEIPLFVVMLSLAGVVTGKQLGHYRPWIVTGAFIFAAVAAPSPDPFSMMALAIPLTGLFLCSELIARFVDRRRAKKAPDAVSDDEASPL